LPVTNYTYDLYAIQGQGIGGQFRPFRSQVGYVYDQYVSDVGQGGDLGLEFGAGNLVHAGVDFRVNNSSSYTGLWSTSNNAIPHFEEKTTNNRPNYQQVYYKKVGEMNIDKEVASNARLFEQDLSKYDPIRIGIGGSGGNFYARNQYEYKRNNASGASMVDVTSSLSEPLKRENRILTGEAIQKKTVEDILEYGNGYDQGLLSEFARTTDSSKNHHTAEISVLQKDGSRYVYGKTAYNAKKVEATFNISGRKPICDSRVSGLVSYIPSVDNSGRNSRGNEYFNRITTPAYAHTYLLSSVLSSDYEDLTNNGPSIDDLGTYTKFTYVNKQPNNGTYKWRIPVEENTASYNEGLKSDATDDMANYVYGEKELLYANTIETKTHIAKFYLSPRQDGYGVKDENGGLDDNSRMYQLDRIALFSKPEYDQKGDSAEPIKVAHFEYNYSLTPETPNSKATTKGKLTLEKVYFTYRSSDMGKYTPYVFTYSDFNPKYNLKNYDVWGNYKEGVLGCSLNDPLTVSEFPYVEQNKEILDRNVGAWTLKSIGLPSGGRLDIETESDDYQYVQNKQTMRMFKVVGAGDTEKEANIDTNKLENTFLYNTAPTGPGSNISHLYVEIDKNIQDVNDLKRKIIDPIGDEPIYFRFLLNIRKEGALGTNISNNASFDYVTGYLFLNNSNNGYSVFQKGTKKYAAIPIAMSRIEDNTPMNPISKAGFNFARKYLNNIAYSSVNNRGVNSDDPLDVLKKLLGSLESTLNIFQGPNVELKQERCAQRFISEKSWIRLPNPSTNKLGGGCRIKSIQMYDQWGVMTNTDNPIYGQFYGQEYTYTLENGSSSGVATYEPLISKENPFVEPIFETREKILAPGEDNYVEKPLGESFFPSPAVTYSRVEVQNLQRKTIDPITGEVIAEVKKHATGKVVNEFYTSYEYPTVVDYTPIEARRKVPVTFNNPFYIDEQKEMALSQGFVIHTNDMNGKQKSQKVFAEGQELPLSGVDYIYHEVDPAVYEKNPINGKLKNLVKVIDAEGAISDKLIGVEFDVINDFRETGSSLSSNGVDFNVGSFLAAIFPVIVPFPLPNVANHKDKMKSVTTTKVIHTSGILKEKIAYDLGSKVATSNLAWDANTGEVLLTETVNEYGDQYYNLNYPAYWAYKGMGQASQNLGLEWNYEAVGNHFELTQNRSAANVINAIDYLANGDEVTTEYRDGDNDIKETLWVTKVGDVSTNSFSLMKRDGKLLNPQDILPFTDNDALQLRVVRSGYRNQQGASMASITLMKNPLVKENSLDPSNPQMNDKLPSFDTNDWNTHRIVNTSAVEYSDLWATQCEVGLPKFELPENIPYANQDEYTDVICFNPYLHNVRGDWRAKRSYAYLTGRQASEAVKLRKDGFYNDFKPLYTPSTTSGLGWQLNTTNINRWTFASAVTQYSPYGAELENKDALNRYSSAQYGYNYTLPTAVSSNSQYRSMGFDGFEDYVTTDATDDHFGFKAWEAENSGSYSTTTSHTGRASIAVAPGKKATLSSRLVPCPEGNPVAVDDTGFSVVFRDSIAIPVTINDDFGLDGPSESAITISTPPRFGNARVDDNGTPNDPTDDIIVYVAGSSNPGVVNLAYEICDTSCTADGKGDCDSGLVSIEVINPVCANPNCPYPNCNCDPDPIRNVRITKNLVPVSYISVFDDNVLNYRCIGRKSTIPISGIPNSTVRYRVSYVYHDPDGTSGVINGKEVIYSNEHDNILSATGNIQLDNTGNAIIRFDMNIETRRGRNEYAKVKFELLGNHSSRYNAIIFDINSFLRECIDPNTRGIWIDYDDYIPDCPNGPDNPCTRS